MTKIAFALMFVLALGFGTVASQSAQAATDYSTIGAAGAGGGGH